MRQPTDLYSTEYIEVALILALPATHKSYFSKHTKVARKSWYIELQWVT